MGMKDNLKNMQDNIKNKTSKVKNKITNESSFNKVEMVEPEGIDNNEEEVTTGVVSSGEVQEEVKEIKQVKEFDHLEIVDELPMQPVRYYQNDKGETIKLMTVKEALIKFLNN